MSDMDYEVAHGIAQIENTKLRAEIERLRAEIEWLRAEKETRHQMIKTLIDALEGK